VEPSGYTFESCICNDHFTYSSILTNKDLMTRHRGNAVLCPAFFKRVTGLFGVITGLLIKAQVAWHVGEKVPYDS